MARRSESGKRDSRSSRGSRTRPERIESLEPLTESSESPKDYAERRDRLTRVERQARRNKRKRIAFGCLTAFLIAVIAAAGVGVYLWQNFERRTQEGMPEADSAAVETLEANQPEQRGAPFYMIIMGVDNRDGETVARSDTLIVARIDPQQQSATLLSIPRDTRVDIPGHGTQKINAANALGGPALVIETVIEFTGLPISHYVEIDFNGFKDIVDALGGVTVDVPQKIQDPKAGNYDVNAYTIYAGEQVLNGAQSLTFVRSRNFPEGDIARIQNQQIFIKALLKESLQLSNALRIPQLVDAVAGNITTDMTAGELISLANDMKGMEGDALETVTMPGEPRYVGGVSYVIVDDDEFKSMIDRVSQGLRAVPDPEEIVLPEPSSISVAIRNGAGIGGVAADAESRLVPDGFVIGEVGNANQFIYDETLIVYGTDGELMAQVVQESLGIGKLVPSRGMYAFDTDVLVVVGKDWGEPDTSPEMTTTTQ